MFLRVISIYGLILCGHAFRIQSKNGIGRSKKSMPQRLVSPESIEGLVLEDIIRGIDVVREAYVPENTDGALAIGLSETVAGGVGALISRGVANAVGDKKVDSVQTKVTSTSAYFGVRSFTRGFARILGLPAPIALVLSSITGSIALETTKASFRTRNEEKLKSSETKTFTTTTTKKRKTLSKNTQSTSTSDESNTATKNTAEGILKSVRKVISLREVGGDVTKWVIFDLFLQVIPSSAVGSEKNLFYFAYGSLSAILGNFVKLIPSRNLEDKAIQNIREKSIVSSYSQAALEGGVLFLTYSYALYEAQELVPNQLNIDFFFNTMLSSVEESVENTILENGL